MNWKDERRKTLLSNERNTNVAEDPRYQLPSHTSSAKRDNCIYDLGEKSRQTFIFNSKFTADGAATQSSNKRFTVKARDT